MVYRDSGHSSSGALVMKPLSYPIQSKRACPTVCVGLEGRQGVVSLGSTWLLISLFPFLCVSQAVTIPPLAGIKSPPELFLP